jgi:pyruvate dehydrogenase E2 component (dihydrolipoamide acetyltransferase)
MAVAFRLADLGEGITEAEIVEWLVAEGDVVSEHQILVRVETDKALVEVPSPAAGRIGRLRHQNGDTVHVGDILVWILGEGEREEDLAGESAQRTDETERATSVVGSLDQAPVDLPPHAAPPRTESVEVLATPAVRRLARLLGVPLESVHGTGHEGRITEADVREHATRAELTPAPPQQAEDTYGPVHRLALRGIRRAIARRLKTAVTQSVLVTHMDEIDVTDLVAQRRPAGEHGVVFASILKAVAMSLKEHPRLNATFDDVHEEVLLRQYVNLGVAVDTPDGLMVPVLHNAERLTVEEIATAVERFAAACRDRTIDVSSLRGGTFSVSNIGSLGGLFATPIPNYPEIAILATGRIVERLVREKDGVIVARHMLPVSLSFDHRVVDGADAARFVKTLAEKLAALSQPTQ